MASERRFPIRSTHGIPSFVLFRWHFTCASRSLPAWDNPKLCLLECLHLVCDIGPVVSRYFLLDFLEQVGEVVQAADRRVVSVLTTGLKYTVRLANGPTCDDLWAARPVPHPSSPLGLLDFGKADGYTLVLVWALLKSFRHSIPDLHRSFHHRGLC